MRSVAFGGQTSELTLLAQLFGTRVVYSREARLCVNSSIDNSVEFTPFVIRYGVLDSLRVP